MKSLLWFIIGVAVGVFGISFYELFGKPVLPFDGKPFPEEFLTIDKK